MSADLAGLAARLSALGWTVIDYSQGPRFTYGLNEFRLLDGFVEVDATLYPGVWEALDIIREWQSGPPAAADPVAITEAMVEAAAEALWDRFSSPVTVPWADLTEGTRNRWRRYAVPMLEAAESARRSQS